MSNQPGGHISLSQLQTLIRQSIDNAHPLPYWVAAEISELKVNYSGHCYIELVEKGGDNHVPRAKASAVIWRNSYTMISSYFAGATQQALGAGLRVLVKVVVMYHELYGLSLQITDIDPTYTLGDMERQRQETIARLQQDGVFDMNREIGLPAVIQRLAVVSSRNAAGYQDFIKELERSGYRFEITLFDAFMQGGEAENSIVAALEALSDETDRFDVVILIRGGGSQSDLGAFNSYRLCCHIAQFPLPVITGIGHDKDRSVADLVAAVSLKTPTAVAVYLSETMDRFDAGLDELWRAVGDSAAVLIDRQRQSLAESAHALRLVSGRMVYDMGLRLERLQSELQRRTEGMVRAGSNRLEMLESLLRRQASGWLGARQVVQNQLEGRLRSSSQRYVVNCRRDLASLYDRVMSRDPQRIIDMGFAVVRVDGKALADGDRLQAGDNIRIQMRHATVDAAVRQVHSKNAKNKIM